MGLRLSDQEEIGTSLVGWWTADIHLVIMYSTWMQDSWEEWISQNTTGRWTIPRGSRRVWFEDKADCEIYAEKYGHSKKEGSFLNGFDYEIKIPSAWGQDTKAVQLYADAKQKGLDFYYIPGDSHQAKFVFNDPEYTMIAKLIWG